MYRKIIFVIGFCFSSINCKNDFGNSGTSPNSALPDGSPQLQMLSRALPQKMGVSDVPGPIQQLNFQLHKIQVISEERKIYTVYRERQEIDLIALKTDNLMELFKSNLPSGRYCEVRMFFSRNGTAVINDKAYPISMKDKPEMRHPWEWGKRKGSKHYSKPDKPSDNPCFLPKIAHESRKHRGFKNKDFHDFDFFNSSDSDDFDLESSYGQPYWRWGRHWLQSHTLYHLRRGMTAIRMKSAFELTAGRIYSMTINFDPSQSVYKQFGRYYLDPDIELTSSTLVDGPFSASGLIEDETVVTELSADGSMRMLTTFQPNAELQGVYFFNQVTRVLSLQLTDVNCATCTGAEEIPATIFYNLPNSDVKVTTWDTTNIIGTVGAGLLERTATFTKTNAFAIDTSTGYTTLNVTVAYSASNNTKFGVLSLVPKTVAGRTYADVQQIQNQTATFVFKIPYKELPGGVPGGSKVYFATPMIASSLTDLKMSAQNNGAVCGDVALSAKNYVLTVPVADKLITANVDFVSIP